MARNHPELFTVRWTTHKGINLFQRHNIYYSYFLYIVYSDVYKIAFTPDAVRVKSLIWYYSGKNNFAVGCWQKWEHLLKKTCQEITKRYCVSPFATIVFVRASEVWIPRYLSLSRCSPASFWFNSAINLLSTKFWIFQIGPLPAALAPWQAQGE